MAYVSDFTQEKFNEPICDKDEEKIICVFNNSQILDPATGISSKVPDSSCSGDSGENSEGSRCVDDQ